MVDANVDTSNKLSVWREKKQKQKTLLGNLEGKWKSFVTGPLMEIPV